MTFNGQAARNWGSVGGRTRAATLSEERLSEIGRAGQSALIKTFASRVPQTDDPEERARKTEMLYVTNFRRLNLRRTAKRRAARLSAT